MAVYAIQDAESRAFIKKLIDSSGKIDRRSSEYVSELSVYVFQDIIDHFAKEEGPEGPWTPWSRAYAEHAAKRGQRMILQDTGRLRNSTIMSRPTSEGILWFNPAKTESGFPYAAAHDEGGPTLPKRSFMWLSDLAQEKIAEATLRFMLR